MERSSLNPLPMPLMLRNCAAHVWQNVTMWSQMQEVSQPQSTPAKTHDSRERLKLKQLQCCRDDNNPEYCELSCNQILTEPWILQTQTRRGIIFLKNSDHEQNHMHAGDSGDNNNVQCWQSQRRGAKTWKQLDSQGSYKYQKNIRTNSDGLSSLVPVQILQPYPSQNAVMTTTTTTPAYMNDTNNIQDTNKGVNDIKNKNTIQNSDSARQL